MSSRVRVGFCFFVALVCVTAVNANADTLCTATGSPNTDLFTLTSTTETISFILPNSLNNIGCSFSGTGSGFEIDNVNVSVGTSPPVSENFRFFTTAAIPPGGLEIGTLDGIAADLVSLTGPQLFSFNNPSMTSATFNGGSFSLTSCGSSCTSNGSAPLSPALDFTLNITPVGAAVPEPSTILLLGGGLAAAIGALRRKLRLL